MQSKHQKTLKEIFEQPTRSNIRWQRVKSLLSAIGAELSEGAGSRVRVTLNDVQNVFHRPHPGNEMKKSAVTSLRDFLIHAGISPDDET